jgi:sugar phosphate isomerase/epimerase
VAPWTLGINNHRMYYRGSGPGRQDRGGEHRQVAGFLSRLARDLAASAGPGAMAAVQYGAESEDLLADQGLLEHLRSLASRTGASAIIHHPDRSTPGTEGFVPSLHQSLKRSRYLGSEWVVVHAPTGCSMSAFDIAYCGLTDEVIVQEVAGSGVGIAVENHGPSEHGRLFGRMDVLGRLVSMVKETYEEKGGQAASSRIGICLDFGHLVAHECSAGRDASGIGEGLGAWSRLVTVAHIHNNDGSGDQHLLLGERPEGISEPILLRHERMLLETVTPALDNCRTYVLERNSPYRMESLLASAGLLSGAIRSGACWY